MKLHIRAGNTINKHFRFYMATLFALYMCLMCACETVNININIYPDAKQKYLETVAVRDASVTDYTGGGSVEITGLSIDEFREAGFNFGDSVDISFNNGVEYKDIPYYSGYFGPVDSLIVCGYPGYAHPVIARCYGDHVWEEFGLDDSSTVDISMNEKGKYHDVQEVREIEYSDERDEYGSDAEFANFREIKGGSLRDGMFYRSASPCNDQHCRAFYTDKLAEDNNIGLIINLSDNKEIYEEFCVQEGYKSDYYSMLYNDGKVLFMPINANYKSDDFAARIAESFMSMAKQKSPTLIHCLEGKDRTGFASALLLALAGASMQEIMDDYMISYDNYYGITEECDPVKYNAVLESFKSFIRYLCNAGEEDDLSNLDIKTGAEEYLKKGGLDPAQIKEIEDYITVEK